MSEGDVWHSEESLLVASKHDLSSTNYRQCLLLVRLLGLGVIVVILPLTLQNYGRMSETTFGLLQLPANCSSPRCRVRQLLSRVPLIDGHNDLEIKYRKWVHNHVEMIDLNEDLSRKYDATPSSYGSSQTDIPRLRQGMVGAQFWSLFVECSSQGRDAVRISLDQADTIFRIIHKYPETFKFVDTAQGILDAFHEGRIASLIGLAGGHSIDSSLATLRMFYRLGVRYMTLTHNCNTPWSDSNLEDKTPGPSEHNGLTDWGKNVVMEMNRLGMLVDISHVSEKTMEDVLLLAKAPIIFSHSSSWILCHHPRNVQDHVLRLTVNNGGVVMVTFVDSFINCDKQLNATLKQLADHIEYIRGDYDGASMPIGLEDVSKYPDLFVELVQRGWSDEELSKLAVRDKLMSQDVRPIDDLIPKEDIKDKSCRPDF